MFAFFAALFIAVLAALGRELMQPRLSGPRQLASLTGLSPLVVMPAGRRRRRAQQEGEAYQALAASLRLELSESQRVVVVTSPHVAPGRAAVASGSAARWRPAGSRPCSVSADLRRPLIHGSSACRRRRGSERCWARSRRIPARARPS